MSLAREISRLAAERLVAAADTHALVFDLSRHPSRADGTCLWTYEAGLAGDRLVRRTEEDRLALLAPDGRTLAVFRFDERGYATVDCGAGPTAMSGRLGASLPKVLGRILGNTGHTDLMFGGKAVWASDAHDEVPLYREDDGSTWYLLPTAATRDADRRAKSHSLGTDAKGNDAPGYGSALMSLVATDGARIATAWVGLSGSKGHRLFDDRARPGDWSGPRVVSIRLLFGEAGVPLREGRNEEEENVAFVDGGERLHNLLGPALFVGEDAARTVYAIGGVECPAEDYAGAAVVAWMAERGVAGAVTAADRDAWLAARVQAEKSELLRINSSTPTRFDAMASEYFHQSKPGEPMRIVDRILARVTVADVEAVSTALRRYAFEQGPSYESGAEMAIAEGLLEPEKADPQELARMAEDAGQYAVAEALAATSPEEALTLCRPLLRACAGLETWEVVEAALTAAGVEAPGL